MCLMDNNKMDERKRQTEYLDDLTNVQNARTGMFERDPLQINR